MQFLKRAWRGKEKLWKVFYLYGGIGAIIPALAVRSIAQIIIESYREDKLLPYTNLMAALFLTYYLFWSAALWKCRRNVKRRFWMVLVGAYYAIITFLLGAILYELVKLDFYTLYTGAMP